jgi:F-type H+-transporting ATPase subunit b
MEIIGLKLTSVMLTIAAAEGEGSSEGLAALGISLGKFLWQLLAFGILVFILARFALPSILKVLDERRARAAEIVEGSDRIKRELADTEARTRQIMADANKRAQEIVAQANATSDRIVNDAAAKAQAAQQLEIDKARSQIAAERDQAIAQLRREFADLAILAATRVVKEELTINPDLQRKLITDTLANADGRNN